MASSTAFSAFGVTPAHNFDKHTPYFSDFGKGAPPYRSKVSPTDLKLFSSLPASYDPSTQWLDGLSPLHPHFNDATRIQSIVNEIKDEVLGFALEGCRLILDGIAPSEEPNHDLLSRSLSQNPNLWRAVLMAQHYGVIYFMSRADARGDSGCHLLMEQHRATADAIDFFLSRPHGAAGTRAINYAVHAYVTRGGLTADSATACVPPNAISAAGPRHVVVREADFSGRDPVADVLATRTPMWDLHDLAHLSCATLCEGLYGNKYQDHLVRLPRRLTALVRSPGMRTAAGPWASDGLVFSELLTKLYTDAVADDTQQQQQQLTYAGLVAALARALADYLLGERSLVHPSTGRALRLSKPVSATELAVLAQNKSYELPASEIEQRVFTRGGPPGAEEDVLGRLSARGRAAWLAQSRSWGYFEVRNTIKHRAHKEAYRLVCETLIARAGGDDDGEEKELLGKVMANILYEDWMDGERVNLWDLL
ncbi:hypothetical protein INS49_009048 [Diaporthe citri]|uniref:uncharacterized protein n=1 Tax=Diaporthe citri TaxID=83186 RepID=UPI001C7E43B2|nr:uncharacterized protein INS49_009048 [Diaporthe citri]KAG6363945.1 hypothetical protein INS49_009048 [Diaporthe citri]